MTIDALMIWYFRVIVVLTAGSTRDQRFGSKFYLPTLIRLSTSLCLTQVLNYYSPSTIRGKILRFVTLVFSKEPCLLRPRCEDMLLQYRSC